MSALEVIQDALRLARIRQTEVPSFPLYAPIVAQLEYLESVLTGGESDKQRLREIMIGHYGAREFEESDPEFSHALKDAQLVASRLQRGMKAP
jgi:hypothetical protein